MADPLAFVVAEYPPGAATPGLFASSVLHPDVESARCERDIRAEKAAPGWRYKVCRVSPPREEDQ